MFWIRFSIEYFHLNNFLFIVIITTKSYSQSICCELTPSWMTQIAMACTRTATDKRTQRTKSYVTNTSYITDRSASNSSLIRRHLQTVTSGSLVMKGESL